MFGICKKLVILVYIVFTHTIMAFKNQFFVRSVYR